MSFRQAAKAWGVSHSAIRAWETGYRKPAGLYLSKLKRVLKRSALCFGIALAMVATLRAQSTGLPPDVYRTGISCTFGRAAALASPTTAASYLAVLIVYGGLLLACAFGPALGYLACQRIRKMWTGESRLDANLVNLWRLLLLANGFPVNWSARAVPTRRQLDAVVAILKRGEKPIITVANGELVIFAEQPGERETLPAKNSA